MTAALQAGLAARADRLGAKAAAAAGEALAARIAAEAHAISVEVGDGEVRLSAPGLERRAFGSRKRAADPRLVAMLGGAR